MQSATVLRVSLLASTLLAAACSKREPAPPATADDPAPPPVAHVATTEQPRRADPPPPPAGPQPEELVGTADLPADHAVDDLAVLGDHLYWVAYSSAAGTSSLWRRPLAGGAAEKLQDGKLFRGLVGAGDHLYWHDYLKAYRLAPGGAPEVVLDGRVCDLIADDGVMLVQADKVTRLDGPAPVERPVTGVDLCEGQVVADGEALYWLGDPAQPRSSSDRQVSLWRLGGAPPEVVVREPYGKGRVRNGHVVGGVAVLVGSGGDRGSVVRAPIAGGEPAGFFDASPVADNAIGPDGTLYAAAQMQGDGAAYHIYRLAPDGRGALLARLDDDASLPQELELHGDHIYWRDMDRVRRAPIGDASALGAVAAKAGLKLPAVDPALARFGCAALLTADDVRELCGKTTTVEADEQEGRFSAFACARRADLDGRDDIFLKVQATSSSGARALVKLSAEPDGDRKPRAVDAGDAALLVTGPGFGGGHAQTFLAAKGDAYLEVAVRAAGDAPLCSDDAVIELGKRAVARLP